jgi:hypothetical protein
VTDLADHALLDVWDRVETAPVPLRPAVLLDGLRAGLGEGGEPAEGLPVGRRDRALIAVRTRLFGSRMRCASHCPACGERVEIELDLGLMQGGAPAELAVVRMDDGAWRLRPPTTRDVEAVLAGPPSGRVAALVRRCALDPLPEPLSAALVEAASAALQEADPDAEIELAVACPACGTGWEAPFDIAACLWEDIARAARLLLREVHHLATAYGWSEGEILALPPRRRREYLLIGGA